jgi:hypothetical protein
MSGCFLTAESQEMSEPVTESQKSALSGLFDVVYSHPVKLVVGVLSTFERL